MRNARDDRPLPRQLAPTPVTARRAVVMLIVVLALVRGTYVMFVLRAGEPLVRPDLPATEWNQVMAWASHQPVGTHFLAKWKNLKHPEKDQTSPLSKVPSQSNLSDKRYLWNTMP